MCQGGTPHVGKIVADNEVGLIDAIRVDSDLIDRRLHDIWHRAALNAA